MAGSETTGLVDHVVAVPFHVASRSIRIALWPLDARDLHRRIRGMIEDAEGFIAKLPSDAVGVIFMDGEKPVQPDVNALDRYGRNPGAPFGMWPSSPEIMRAMLESHGKGVS